VRRVFGQLGLLAATLTVLASASWSGAASPKVTRALEFDDPSGLAVAGGHLWVTNQAGNSVTEINRCVVEDFHARPWLPVQ
jgi:hypothetical protein